MSSYVLELLDASHDRSEFVSGLDSVDRYLRETAQSHMEKGVSVTSVLVEAHFKKTGFMTKKFSTGWIWLVISSA